MDNTSQRLLMGSSVSGEEYWIANHDFTSYFGEFRNGGHSLDFDSNDNLILLSTGSGLTFIYSVSQKGIINWAKQISRDTNTVYNELRTTRPKIILSPDKTKIYFRTAQSNVNTGDLGAYFASLNTSNGSFNFKKYFYNGAIGSGDSVGMAINSNGDVVSGYNPYTIVVWPSNGGNPSTKIANWRLDNRSMTWGAGDSYEYKVFDSYNNTLFVCGQYFRASDSNTTGVYIQASASSLSPYEGGELYSSGSYSTNASSIKYNPLDGKIAISGKHNNYPLVGYFNSSGVSWSYYGDGLDHSNKATYIDIDSAGNVYWCFRVGAATIYVVKISSSGTVLWQRVINTQYELTSFKVHKEAMYILSAEQVIKLPLDGTLTGTYVDTGINVTYSSTSLNLVSNTLTYTPKSMSTVAQTNPLSGLTSSTIETTPALTINYTPIP